LENRIFEAEPRTSDSSYRTTHRVPRSLSYTIYAPHQTRKLTRPTSLSERIHAHLRLEYYYQWRTYTPLSAVSRAPAVTGNPPSRHLHYSRTNPQAKLSIGLKKPFTPVCRCLGTICYGASAWRISTTFLLGLGVRSRVGEATINTAVGERWHGQLPFLSNCVF
jgi:hypothetical protein